jgi:hypothetical protein
MTCVFRAFLLTAAAAFAPFASAWELDSRAKLFGSEAWLPDDDLQRELDGSPAYDGSADLRTMLREAFGGWHLVIDHTLLYEGGDTYAFISVPEETLDQTPRGDERRFVDLTWTLEDGDRHELLHRFDRLAVEYRGDRWGVTVGRMAVSWGSGIVFQAIDLFAPFAPTTVDRDYKPGEDLILADGLFKGGSDWELLAVLRRNDEEQRTASADSFGGKWHGYVGAAEVEVLAGRHFRDGIVGASLRHPLGGALLRTDWLLTDVEDGGVEVSGIVNIDYSFGWFARNWYVFAEYSRNGFGTNERPIDIENLPQALRDRLTRGEVFTLMKNYTAIGTQLEWHPLLTQSLTWIANLHDGSSLLQTQLSYEFSDWQMAEVGVLTNLGDAGDEYGGIPLGAAAPGLTTGGGTRLYLRWTYTW